MVHIYNDVDSIDELVKIQDIIYIYGAGASCKLLLKAHWESSLKDHVSNIVDINESLAGLEITVGDEKVKIISIREFGKINSEESLVILLTPAFSSELVSFLDDRKEFNGAKTYLLPMICRNRKVDPFQFRSKGTQLIPKIIHFFWIGNIPIPDDYKKNIDGWKRLCPDYEIICWNEENYDFRSIPYMKEAFEMGSESLMYATDYARMDVLYQHGGIYMDTDVELVKPLDELLYNEAFIGIEENGQVNSGSAIGAMPGHPMIKKLMDSYDGEHFIDEEGRAKRTFNTYFETNCLIENGYKMVNEYQEIGGMACFPREVFMPICFAGMDDCFSDKTVSIHRINPEHQKRNRDAYLSWKDRVIG